MKLSQMCLTLIAGCGINGCVDDRSPKQDSNAAPPSGAVATDMSVSRQASDAVPTPMNVIDAVLPQPDPDSMVDATLVLDAIVDANQADQSLPRMPSCGNSIVEGSERCDDGADSESCDGDCTEPACGDGYTNAVVGLYRIPSY